MSSVVAYVRQFVPFQREYSACGLPAICVEAPLLTELRKGTGDAEPLAKDAIEVPTAMDPTGSLAKFLTSQAVPKRYIFTDDNWVNYGEFFSNASSV